MKDNNEVVDNLKLWHSVEKTNPKYTKIANVKGNKITSIAPQFQIMNVTEQFGVYGEKWGFKDINLDYSLANTVGLVVFKATFFFPNGEFPIINAISLFMDNAKTKVDDNFAKKIETDALTKAISKLGFNADIFMGKFDDIRYVEEMNDEFGNGVKKTEAEIYSENITAHKTAIKKITVLTDLNKYYNTLDEKLKADKNIIQIIKEHRETIIPK